MHKKCDIFESNTTCGGMDMKILLVDDNAFILEVIQRMLDGENHEITPKFNVDEAVTALNEASFDLVITDIVMPEKDGVKLVQYVKAKKPQIPVIAITGGVENAVEDYAHYANMFADEVLTKPLQKDRLIETITRLAA